VLGEADKVAPHACSSSAQLPQAAVKILLRGLVALARGLEVGECIGQSFLESGHGAQGLPVTAPPEQRLVPAMRGDVVNNRGRLDLPCT